MSQKTAAHKVEISLPNVPSKLRKEIKDFLEEIGRIAYLRQDGNPKPEWTIFYGGTLEEARDAAMHAVKDKTSKEGLKSGAAHMAMRIAAQNSGRIEALIDAMKAASSAVNGLSYCPGLNKSDLITDARLFAASLVVKDLDFEGKAEHIAHAEAVMEVWRKGYSLYDDVHGGLFVYAEDVGPKDFISFIKSEVRVVEPTSK